MPDEAKLVLTNAKKFYEKTRLTKMEIKYPRDSKERSLANNTIKYLENEGYIYNLKKSIGLCMFSLTPYCLDLFESDDFEWDDFE